MKDSMVFYRSFLEAIELLPDESQQLEALRAIVRYALNGVEPEVEGLPRAIFVMAKPQIDANNQRHENGKRGGRPKTETEKPMVLENDENKKPMVLKNDKIEKPNVNVNENVNVNDNNIPPIVPPGDVKKLSPLNKTQTERFEKFWQAYPRKESKGAAERAWKKINPDDELTRTITEAIGRAQKLDNRFRERQYTPHPSVWLNGREWENEYDASRSPPSPGSIDFSFEQRNYDEDFLNGLVKGFDDD